MARALRRTALIAVVAAAGVAAIALRGGAPVAVAGAFGQHWRGLEQRRAEAGVATMGKPSADVHEHLRLRVWVDGRRVGVPSGIGIDPARPADAMAALHTHSDDGKIHNEGQADATLGQLFAVWGIEFAPDRLGPRRAGAGKRVQMWVDGRASRALGALRLKDGQEIALAYGAPRSRPPGD